MTTTKRDPNVISVGARPVPHDLFESDPSPVVGDLVLMPVKLAVAIDRVQLFDTLNLSSQRDNLLTKSSIYERQSTRCVECSEGSGSYEVLVGSLG
jgi:hypothetical protein